MGTPNGTDFGIGRPFPGNRHRPYAAWGALAAILPAAAGLLTRMRAIDLAYHVRAGELALRSGAIVREDPFTFTRAGEPWLNQQWGAQVLLAVAHRVASWLGVAVTYAASLGAGFLLLYRNARRAGADPRTGALLTLLGFLVAAGSLGARPQALAVPLFTGTELLLRRGDRTRWAVPAVAAVWANVHGSFVLAPALVGFALAGNVLERRPVGRAALLLGVTVVATFATPFGPAVWAYALDVAGNETIRTTVAEWRPPSPLTGPGVLFWLSGGAVAWAAIRHRDRVRPIHVVRLLVFFALGAAAVRSTLWWAFVAPPLVASWLGSGGATSAVDRRPARAPAAAVAVGAAAVVLLAAWLRSGTDPATGAPARLSADAPETLVEATRRALPAGSRLLVFQPYSSWFELSLPGYPVMVDARIELFPGDVWRDYDVAIVAGDGWQAILDRHEVDGVVLPPNAILAERLAGEPGWAREADVEAGSVFVREEGAPPPA
jgi:hypothetical protein